jgi:acetyl-CoA acetyltransferase
MSHVAHAMAAINNGLCEVALIAYGSTQRSVSRAAASPREYNAYETPYKPFLPTSAYAMVAARHMYQYGTTREQLAEVAVAARKWALMNPVAWEKKPLTIDEVINARMVSSPLTIRDCCLVTDGGGAIILTSAARAKDLKKAPAYVLGVGEDLSHIGISSFKFRIIFSNHDRDRLCTQDFTNDLVVLGIFRVCDIASQNGTIHHECICTARLKQ